MRRSKAVNLLSGEAVIIFYDYEGLQKRCYTCQRLTHEQELCSIYQKRRKDSKEESSKTSQYTKNSKPPVLSKSDPLYGVLKENQVGIDPVTGRLRMAPEVLEGMRKYLLVAK